MNRLIDTRYNFFWLAGALVFLMFIEAVVAQFDWREAQRLVNITLFVTIVIAVWSVGSAGGSRWMNWKIGMSFIIAILMISDSIIESNFLAVYQLACCFLFLSFTLYICWRQVMFSGDIDGNKIVGAICIYILLGLIWAFAYLLMQEVFPGSFVISEDDTWQHNLGDAVYFSMVTLTTLGYGDITPQEPVVRFMSYLEAVTGVFYTTVLVASLIGIRLAHYSDKLTRDMAADE
ncbi:MAG: two pore domain potassium channel family protein [Haliea sp.]|jgi:hypothetical protein|nr:two pore domain potassium channel family protein [Haliea sp.]